MGSNHHEPVAVDPQSLNEAHAFWGHFTTGIKVGIISVVALLVFMAIFVA